MHVNRQECVPSQVMTTNVTISCIKFQTKASSLLPTVYLSSTYLAPVLEFIPKFIELHRINAKRIMADQTIVNTSV